MEASTILIIEDDFDILEVLSLYVQNEGYRLLKAMSVEEGWNLIKTNDIDLMLIDINLPDGNGIELVKRIREQTQAILFFITANDSIEDKLQGFEVGADDYITKPFIPKEVIARMKAHLNRQNNQRKTQYVVDDLVIDFDKKSVFKAGDKVHLFTKEKQILFYLAEHRDQVLSVDQITDFVWGYEEIVDMKAVAVHISTLRKKIEKNPSRPKVIQTVRGFGYKFGTDEKVN